jgi:hypothetical protein
VNGRHLPARHSLYGGASGSGYGPGHEGRDHRVAVALARLETCAAQRDERAAARVLDGLAATDDGAWLLLQMAAAGLRVLGAGTQHLPTDTVRSPAAAAEVLDADRAGITTAVLPAQPTSSGRGDGSSWPSWWGGGR